MTDNLPPVPEPAQQPFEAPRAPHHLDNRRPKWVTGVSIALVGVIGIGGGIGIGYAAFNKDPKGSTEYAELKETNEKLSTLNRELESEVTTLDIREYGLNDREKTLDAKETELSNKEADLTTREAAVTTVEQQVAANTIREGTWSVGIDIEPGTYRTTQEVGDMCYWAIYKSGTNKSDIIANDLPSGGIHTVTLQTGQDFETKRCGQWTKQ